VVLVLTALGAGGFAYRPGASPGIARAGNPPAKPRNELEALRKENELLKLNLEIVLEKVRTLEAQLRTAKGQATDVRKIAVEDLLRRVVRSRKLTIKPPEPAPDPVKQIEAALKALREAKDPQAKRRAVEALEQAMKKLREQDRAPGKGPRR
jgi:hypothetical protein